MDEAQVSAAPTHGCMACKAQRPYTVHHFPNGNTGWRCVVCGKILHLIPGTCSAAILSAPTHNGTGHEGPYG